MNAEDQDQRIMRELIHQVSIAAEGVPESDVLTRISRPMWKSFCRATGMPEDCEPTAWLGIHNTRRVYGSETQIVESDEMFAISTKRRK